MDYAGCGLNRVTCIIVIDEIISSNYLNKLFGYGISTATSIGSETKHLSQFQKTNTYNFSMFTIAQYLVENGWIGLLLILAVFINTLNISIKLKRDYKNEFNCILGEVGIPFIFSIIFVLFYSMCMEKNNFAIFAWAMLGLIQRTYYVKKIKQGVNNESINNSTNI